MNELNQDLRTAESQTSKKPLSYPQYCRNCGKQAPERFCAWCGQSTKQVRVSMGSLVMDFLGDYFTFDSKLFRSLIPLFFKPGFLTNAFMAGKRATYIPPLRMYVFSSIIFFLSLSLTTKVIDDETTEIEEGTAIVAPIALDGEPGKEAKPATSSDWKREKGNITLYNGSFDEDSKIGAYLNRKIKAQEAKLQEMEHGDLLKALVDSVYKTLPKALFLLMPVFAFFLKLLYVRRDPLYIDHLIFAFHLHACVFLFYSCLLIVSNLFDHSGVTSATISLGFLAPPIYLFLALKRVYKQGWFRTLLKLNILGFVYSFTLLFFIFIVFLVSVMSI